MPAYRARNHPRNGRSPTSRPELPIVSSWSTMRVPTTVIELARALGIDVHVLWALGIDVHVLCGEPRLRRNPTDLLHRGAAKAGAKWAQERGGRERRSLTTLSPNAAQGFSPGQAAAIDCRVGCGFASRKLRHSPACSAEMKKLLPPVALSRITIPCSDVRVITTSPTHGSFRTSGEAPLASRVVEEADEVEGGEDDSPLWPRQPVRTQVEKIATRGGKISAALFPLITRPRILLRG
jgi:hypothetical protein